MFQKSRSFLRAHIAAILAALLLAAATVAVYWQAFDSGFVDYDDNTYVYSNPHVLAGLSGDAMQWAFTTTEAVNWHPLTWLSFQLDQQLYRATANPAGGFHITNVILHVADSLLLFWVLTRMTRRLWRSAFVAALFALHPLHVESVAWISERKDVLSTLFWMLTMAAYVLYVERPHWTRYLLVVLFFALGLMAKSMLVTLPCVLLLLDFWPLRRFSGLDPRPAVSWWYLVAEKIPLLILSAASAAMTVYAQRQGGETNPSDPLSFRIGNALMSCVSYIGKMLWPTGLIPFYPFPHELYPYAVEAGLLLLCATVLVLALARRSPYLIVGWLWFLGTLAPVIGVTPVVGGHAMADRYTYVPLIGLFLLLVWGVAEGLARAGVRAWMTAAVGVVLLAGCMIGTWRQVSYWRDNASLWGHALEVDPKNYLAYNNIGCVLFAQGKTNEAEWYYSRAVDYAPERDAIHSALSHYSLGVVLARQGKADEALFHYTAAVRISPERANYQYTLGEFLAWQGKYPEAAFHFEAAVKSVPTFAGAHAYLGWVLYLEGRNKEAIPRYETALQLEPNSAPFHNDLGLALLAEGDVNGAVAQYKAALEIDPNYAAAHANLAAALLRQGKDQEAAEHSAEAARLNQPAP